MNVSLTGVGAFVTLIELGLRLVGVEIPDGVVASALNGIVTFIGAILLIWGQLRRPEVRAFFWKKQ
jgi:hypothetical protein